MAIKAVIWDIRGVLLEESGSEPRKKLAEKFGFDEEKFKEFSMNNLDNSLRGKFRGDKFFRIMIKDLDLGGVDSRDLADEWIKQRRKTMEINRPVFKVLEKLKNNYVLISFTNSTALNDVVRKIEGIYSNFEFNLVSHQEGFIKPEDKSFKSLLQVLKRKSIHPDEAVLIDDDKGNLIRAREFGLNTIHFREKIQLTKDLKKFGVNV